VRSGGSPAARDRRLVRRASFPDRERELAAIAVLAATAWERQLVSHLKGAVRLGATPREVRTAFDLGRRRSRSAAACRRAWRHAMAPKRAPRGARSKARRAHPKALRRSIDRPSRPP